MDLARFEQLVNDWLDNPADESLRREVEAALRTAPALRIESARLMAIEHLLRAAQQRDVRGVDWTRLRARIRAEVRTTSGSETAATPESDETDERFDAHLARLPGLEGRVDWGQFQTRVATSIRAEAARLGIGRSSGAQRPMRPPASRWMRRSVIAVGLAAAAVLVLSVLLPRLMRPEAPEHVGFSSVTVVSAAARESAQSGDGTQQSVQAARAFASVRVSGPAEALESAAPSEPEFYLFIGPAGAGDASSSSGREASAAGV